jgi:hypothetical protein
MRTDLLRRALYRLTGTLKTASYSCGKCPYKMEITDYPDRVSRFLDIALAHRCTPKPKTL